MVKYLPLCLLFLAGCGVSINIETPSIPNVDVYTKKEVPTQNNEPLDEIDELINNKTPLYLTSNSKYLTNCKELNNSPNWSSYNNGYCYNYVFFIEKNEVKKMPVNFHSMIYPIKKLQNGKLLAVTQPKADYSNENAYNDNEKILIDLKRAENWNEISRTPVIIETPFQDYINSRTPLFLTGNSSAPVRCNNLKFYASTFHDAYDGICYSSVLQNFNNELNSLPLNFKGAIYPIKQINAELLLAVINPLKGNQYSNENSYNSNEKIIINVKNALNNNELSNEPFEFNDKELSNLADLFYHLSKINRSINTDCFSNEILKKYAWKDEFQKRDYVTQLSDNIKSLVKTNINYSNELFIDYQVKFDEFNFNNLSYTITVEDSINLSENIKNSFLKSKLNWNSNNAFKNFSNDNRTGTIKLDEAKARQINDVLNNDRKLFMRLYLAPSASTSNKCDCQDLTKCVLPFNVDRIAFSNNFDFSNGIQP